MLSQFFYYFLYFLLVLILTFSDINQLMKLQHIIINSQIIFINIHLLLLNLYLLWHHPSHLIINRNYYISCHYFYSLTLYSINHTHHFGTLIFDIGHHFITCHPVSYFTVTAFDVMFMYYLGWFCLLISSFNSFTSLSFSS